MDFSQTSCLFLIAKIKSQHWLRCMSQIYTPLLKTNFREIPNRWPRETNMCAIYCVYFSPIYITLENSEISMVIGIFFTKKLKKSLKNSRITRKV